MAAAFRDVKTSAYQKLFEGLGSGTLRNINIGVLVGLDGVKRSKSAPSKDLPELIMKCTVNLAYNDVVIFMSDGYMTVLGKVVAGTVSFADDMVVDNKKIKSSSGQEYVIKAGSKLISAGTDYRRMAYNLKIICRDHKVKAANIKYELVQGRPRVISKRERSSNYFCADGSVFRQYYKDIFHKDPEDGEELIGVFIAAFTTCHKHLMLAADVNPNYRSLEVICHWDPLLSLSMERDAFIKKAKMNAKRELKLGKFKNATATPNKRHDDKSKKKSSGGRVDNDMEVDPRGGTKRTREDDDESSTRPKAKSSTNPPTSQSQSSSSSSGTGSSGTGSSGTGSSGTGSIDSQEFDSSSEFVITTLKAMLNNQTRINKEFKKVLTEAGETNQKKLMDGMSTEILRGNILTKEDEQKMSAEEQLSKLDRQKLFEDNPGFEKSLVENQEHLYEFSIRNVLCAFFMHNVDSDNLESFIEFITNPACTVFMAALNDEKRSLRLGALNAIVTLYAVLFKARGKDTF